MMSSGFHETTMFQFMATGLKPSFNLTKKLLNGSIKKQIQLFWSILPEIIIVYPEEIVS